MKETGHWAGAGNCTVMLLAPHKMEGTHLLWRRRRSRKEVRQIQIKGCIQTQTQTQVSCASDVKDHTEAALGLWVLKNVCSI